MVYSTHPPAAVYGTGDGKRMERLFSASPSVARFGRSLSWICNDPATNWVRVPFPLNFNRRHRNIHLLSIDYALRPHLRSRLTLEGRNCPGNLRFTATRILTWFIATHVCILTRPRSTLPYGHASAHGQRFPTRLVSRSRPKSVASVLDLIANHFRREIAR